MSKVLFVLTSNENLGETGRTTGWYVPEAAHPWKVLSAAGYEIDIASIAGGAPRPDGIDPNDPIVTEFLQAMGPKIASTTAMSDVDPADYDAVFYVGGHGTMWDFPGNPDVQRVTRSLWEAGGVVGAVCHGPAALVDIPLADGSQLVDGRNVSAFTNDEERAVSLDAVVPFFLAERLGEQGARHTHADVFGEHVVVDGRLVTGQNPASAAGVGQKMVEVLATVRASSPATAR